MAPPGAHTYAHRMRTTVVLDDGLVKKAKKRAAELKIPFREFVNQALRDFFSKPPPEQKPPQSHYTR